MFKALLTLIFIRPFISSLAFPFLNALYSSLLITLLIVFCVFRVRDLKHIKILSYPIIVFSLGIILSVIFSSNRVASFNETYKYASGLLMLLIIASLHYEDRICVIKTIVLAGFIISLLAIYQYFFGFQHILDYMSKTKITDSFALDYIQRRRAFLPFITPNTLAGYLIMIIPLALIHKNTTWYIIPLSFALFLTKSLGAFFSIFLALIIYFCLHGRFKKRSVLFLYGIMGIIALVFIARSATQKEHLQPIFSTVMRLSYWKETLGIIKDHPLVGIGAGNFNLAQSRFAHNSYLQIWAEMGILGIISILWFVFAILKSGFKINHSNNISSKNQFICLITASAAFLINNLVDFTFFLPEVSLTWWIVSGLIISKEST
jgi:putative inorganic carbon (HCO3(-)) transporter